MKTLKWFYSKIGKRIYRNAVECCSTCRDISLNGIVVHDKNHAQYLFDIQNDFMSEGIDLDYRSKL